MQQFHVNNRMEQEITNCLKILKDGGTILYPTDTIWGIGCDATNQEAVDKVYKIKKRVDLKSLIIMLDDARKLPHYVTVVPHIAWDLLKHIETPLTIIYPGAKNLAPNVVATDGSVGIRIVRNEFCIALIKAFGKPIVSTSANISGENHPVIYKNISTAILNGVDYKVSESFAELKEVKPSQIIKIDVSGEFKIIRK